MPINPIIQLNDSFSEAWRAEWDRMSRALCLGEERAFQRMAQPMQLELFDDCVIDAGTDYVVNCVDVTRTTLLPPSRRPNNGSRPTTLIARPISAEYASVADAWNAQWEAYRRLAFDPDPNDPNA